MFGARFFPSPPPLATVNPGPCVEEEGGGREKQNQTTRTSEKIRITSISKSSSSGSQHTDRADLDRGGWREKGQLPPAAVYMYIHPIRMNRAWNILNRYAFRLE